MPMPNVFFHPGAVNNENLIVAKAYPKNESQQPYRRTLFQQFPPGACERRVAG